MPIDKYFKGHGAEVMTDMKKRYGKEGERAFYATANKRGLKPEDSKSKRPGKRASFGFGK